MFGECPECARHMYIALLRLIHIRPVIFNLTASGVGGGGDLILPISQMRKLRFEGLSNLLKVSGLEKGRPRTQTHTFTSLN